MNIQLRNCTPERIFRKMHVLTLMMPSTDPIYQGVSSIIIVLNGNHVRKFINSMPERVIKSCADSSNLYLESVRVTSNENLKSLCKKLQGDLRI